jgi:cyclopropane-fatty-acyl-phospholipid synthase
MDETGAQPVEAQPLRTKSVIGLPEPLFPQNVDLAAEAAKARRRLLPVTVLYTAASLITVAFAVRSGAHPGVCAAFVLAGAVTWTLLEYIAHRYILHGPFPDGPGPLQHFLHRQFDHLHVAHHERPWDGNHISGTIRDTLPLVLVLAGLAALAPLHTAPLLLVGIVQSYVIGEWIHHSVHFYKFDSAYFRYIRRHHLYHHSRHGQHVAFGLTSHVWDLAWGTPVDPPLGSRPATPERPTRRAHAIRNDPRPPSEWRQPEG